jgi:LysM repeat protein
MHLKRLLTVLTLLASLALRAQNEDVINYINTWKETAMSEMQRTGVPASITLAQGIHESMAGKSPLSIKSNNHFGIKCKSDWQGEKVYHDDDARGECFRSYPSAEQSYTDHSDFLRNSARYGFLFQLDPADYKEWAYGLKKAGYATNVRYSQILIKLIEDYNLNQYSLIAMGNMQRSDEVILASNKTIPVIREIQTTITPKEGPVNEPEVNDEALAKKYPASVFTINNTKVIFARAGTSLLVLANEHNISLGRLLDFNDMKQEDVLVRSQLLFLQRKRKTGENNFHTVQPNESLYDIAQAEGIRLESLLEYNFLQAHMQPATGENLFLKSTAPGRPKLAEAGPAITGDLASNTSLSTHVVQDKETLFSIARKYGTTVAKLREWNKLAAVDLRIGQELVIYKN